MREIAAAFALGALVGAIFAAAKLRIPAPDNLAGVMGVVGLFAGFWIVTYLRGAPG